MLHSQISSSRLVGGLDLLDVLEGCQGGRDSALSGRMGCKSESEDE